MQGAQINEAACDLAREVANEGDALVAGGVSQTPSYLSCKSETDVKATFKKQLDVFIKKNVDFLIAEVENWIITHLLTFSGGYCARFSYLSHVDSSMVWLSAEVSLLQYFEHVEEAVWAVEVLKQTGKPVAATLCIGPEGDMHGVSPGECAVRLVKAGEYGVR